MVWFAYAAVAAVGVIQLPFLLDALDAAFPRLGLGRVNHAVVAKLLVALLTALMFAAYGVFVLYFVPHLWHAPAAARWAVALQVGRGGGLPHR